MVELVRTFLPGTLCFLATLVGPSSPAATLSSGWSNEIRLGYDHFSHNYRLIDQDTTNTFSEGNLRVKMAYRPPDGGGAAP